MEVAVLLRPRIARPRIIAAESSASRGSSDWLARYGRLIFIGFLALGIGVRVRHYVAAPSFWYDEAYLLVNIFEKSFLELTGPLQCEQAAPPLFLWALRGLYLVFGPSEWAMRLPAFAASVASLLLMVPLARRFVGGRGALWAVGFLAVSQAGCFNGNLVKPYAGDLLATEVILLVAATHLTNVGPRRMTWPALLAAALIGPWFSYPSVFAIGGAGLALFADAILRRSGKRFAAAGLVALTGACSFAVLWWLIGRVQRSDFLSVYWQQFFLDLTSVPAAVRWVAGRLFKIGQYGTSGMGVPLLIFTLIGATILWRKRSIMLFLPAGMFALMFLANALRCYPLEDRLFFFALPAWWLLAAVGIGAIVERVRRRWKTLALVLLFLPLVEGTVRYVGWIAVVPSKVEFRDAFAYVEQRQAAGDCWWVSHPEVYDVYFGNARPCLSGALPETTVAERRLWLIGARSVEPDSAEEENIRRLTAQGFALQERKDLATVRVSLFVKPLK